jgi:hypothetical protein
MRCKLLGSLLAISMLASCRPEIPWGWKAHIASDSLVVWLPSSYWTLPPEGDGPQFADSSHSTYLLRVPAKRLYEPWLISRATREGSLNVRERRTDTLTVDGRQLLVERAIGSGLVGRPAPERLIAVHIPLDAQSGAVLFSAYDGDADRTLIAIAATVKLREMP